MSLCKWLRRRRSAAIIKPTMALSAAAAELTSDPDRFNVDAFHGLTEDLMAEARIRSTVVGKTQITLPEPMGITHGGAKWQLPTGGRLFYIVEEDKISLEGFLDRDGKELTHQLNVDFVKGKDMLEDHFEVRKMINRPAPIYCADTPSGQQFVFPQGMSVSYTYGHSGQLKDISANGVRENGDVNKWSIQGIQFVRDGLLMHPGVAQVDPILMGSKSFIEFAGTKISQHVELVLRHSGTVSEPGNLSLDVTSLNWPLRHGQHEQVTSFAGANPLDERVQMKLTTDRIRHMVAYAIAEMLKIGKGNARRGV